MDDETRSQALKTCTPQHLAEALGPEVLTRALLLCRPHRDETKKVCPVCESRRVGVSAICHNDETSSWTQTCGDCGRSVTVRSDHYIESVYAFNGCTCAMAEDRHAGGHANECPLNTLEDSWGFWRELVCDEEGNLRLSAVKAELHDYGLLLDQVPRVYDHVSGGRITKPFTPLHEILSAADEHYAQLYGEPEEFDL